jgi:hypothetical protein
LSHDEVVDFIKGKAGTQFAPPVVDAFVAVVKKESGKPHEGSHHVSRRSPQGSSFKGVAHTTTSG